MVGWSFERRGDESHDVCSHFYIRLPELPCVAVALGTISEIRCRLRGSVIFSHLLLARCGRSSSSRRTMSSSSDNGDLSRRRPRPWDSSDSEDGTFGALANVVPKEDGLAVLGNSETGVQRGLQQGGHGKKKLKQGNLFAMMGGRPTPPSRPGGAGVVGKSQQASIFSMLGGRGSALSTGREGRAAGARWVSMTRAC